MNSSEAYGLLQRRRRRSGLVQRRVARRLSRVLLGLGAVLLLVSAFGLLALTLAYANLTRDLPSPAALPALLDPQAGAFLRPTRLYDRTGQHLLRALEVPGVERRYLPLAGDETGSLSQHLVDATLAVADPGFWQHGGYSLDGIAAGTHPTLAQRLVSDLLLQTEPPGLRRALRERLLAAQLTARYGREQVLEWYLNSAYYGHLAYGAEAAARTFLGKSASSLTAAEAALLAGVAETPALNPLDAPEAARERQQAALELMFSRGVLTVAEYGSARETRLAFQVLPAATAEPARAFTALALEQLADEFGLARIERGGLDVITTLDYELQLQMSCAAQSQLLRAAGQPVGEPTTLAETECAAARLLPTLAGASISSETALSASLVVLDPSTSETLALVGETGPRGETAAFLSHPAGTLLTPFIYFSGFTRGLGPATLVWDLPPEPGPSSAEQASAAGYQGPLRLRAALAGDVWIPAWRLLREIGPQEVWSLAARFGLTVEPDPDDPFASQPGYDFGSASPLQAAQAYAVFASGGVLAGQEGDQAGQLEPGLIRTVIDASGQALVDHTQPVSRPLLSPPLAHLINAVLSDETARWPSLGHPNPLEIGRPAAAKLGVTPAGQDAWAAGYTPQRVIVVWMGSSSAGLAQPIDPLLPAGLWHAAMQYAARDLPPAGWNAPPGIVTAEVCDPSGLLPTAVCPEVVSEIFLEGSQPNQADTLYRQFQVNRETGRLATVFTPPELVEERVFLLVPAEAQAWASAAGLPVPPDQYDTIQVQPPTPGALLEGPAMFSVVSGVVSIRGTAAGDDFSVYRVQVGSGLNPREWLQIGEDGQRPVTGADLARWDTTGLSGLYAVRLQVVRTGQRVDTAILQVTVDNSPPTARVTYPAPAEVLTRAAGQVLTFQAQAADDIGLERLDWLVDGRPVETQRQGPFSLAWPASPGRHTVQVVAVDLAGSQTPSSVITFEIEER